MLTLEILNGHLKDLNHEGRYNREYNSLINALEHLNDSKTDRHFILASYNEVKNRYNQYKSEFYEWVLVYIYENYVDRDMFVMLRNKDLILRKNK